MGKHKILIFSFLFLLGSAWCSARQVSFQIVQHDGPSELLEESLTIEDEVMNNFFDYGYIVTNSDAQVSSSEKQDEKLFNTGIGEAIEGFSDYFIQIKLFYNSIWLYHIRMYIHKSSQYYYSLLLCQYDLLQKSLAL